MVRDIGSIFPATTGVTTKAGLLPFAPASGDVRFYSLCREIFSALARRHGDCSRRVLIPAYTCVTVVEPFRANGWQVRYYGVNADLTVDGSSLLAACASFDPDVVIVHPYYGMGLSETEQSILRRVKTDRRILVKDLTQCLFVHGDDDGLFDYCVGSLRKWLPMPDGAFVSSSVHSLDGMPEACGENTVYVSLELEAMHLRGEYYQTGDVETKARSRALDAEAVGLIEHETELHEMSAHAVGVLDGTDLAAVAATRFRNYRFLFEHLDSPRVKRVCTDLSRVTTAPLYFPVLVDDRPALVAKLIPERIYAPVLWPEPDAVAGEMARFIYDSILALPIDQRYGVDDMCRIVEAVNGYK